MLRKISTHTLELPISLAPKSALNLVLHLALVLSLVFSPVATFANSTGARMLLETNVADIDSTRLALDFHELSFEELGDLPRKLRSPTENPSEIAAYDHSDILPSTQQALRVHVFVPSHLDENLKSEFLKNVEEQMGKTNPQLRIEIQSIDLDLENAEAQAQEANARLQITTEQLQAQPDLSPEQADLLAKDAQALQSANRQILAGLQNWSAHFKESATRFNQWRHWWRTGATKTKDERIGGWIGQARGMASAMVWFSFNNLGVASMAQVSASFYLDWFFSKYERRVDIFKGTHRIPLEQVPVLGYAVRFYNERPLLKSWVIGNLIGFSAGSYFRFWSWFENPERTSPPWSMDALSTYTSLVGIGNLAAAFGAQGPRIMRKKGYMNSRAEYYVYVTYGIMFQIGGFLYGLGSDVPALAFATGESIFKMGFYGAARLKPWKEARAFVFHPELVDKEIEELLYRVGLEKSETTSIDRKDLPSFIERLKNEQSLSWKKRLRQKIGKIPGCSFLLTDSRSVHPRD